ncbi:MAG TPA: hypothetical protein VGC54_03635 [Planctomycetota bacterium]
MRILLPLLLVTAFATAEPAQDIIALNYAGDVYSIDPASGADRFIGASGEVNLNSMARNGTGTL